MKPLGIDLFCGLGGFTEGLLAENFEVIGFDIERHDYGDAKYPAQLIPHRTAGHWTNPAEHEGAKQGGDWFNVPGSISRSTAGNTANGKTKSNARKAASAQIAKIPLALSTHIARSWKPANFIEQEVESAA